MDKLWWVRLPTGEEFGPISTSALQRLIEKGMVTASDEVGADPDKEYIPIKDSNFYPLFHRTPEFAAHQEPTKEEKTEELQKSVSRTIKTGTQKEPELQLAEKTEPDAPQFGTVKVSVLKTKPSNTRVEPQRADASRVRPRVQETRIKPPRNTIEMTPQKKFKIDKDLLIKGALAIIVVACVVFLLLPEEPKYSEEAIHLASPKENTRQLNDAQIQDLYEKAKAEFEADRFGGYLFSMNQLVTAAESVTLKSEVLSLLCLTYFELWPYSHKDSEDLSAVIKLAQLSAKADPAGPHGGACRSIQQILNNRLDEANNILDGLLTEHAGAAHLYYLKARALEIQGNFATAAAYSQKSQELWSAWSKPFVKQAYLEYRAGKSSEASNNARNFLKSKPKHNGAKVVLGIVEYRGFRHIDSAIELLKPALSSGDRIEPNLAAEGAFALAEAYSEKGDNNSAAEWARKAYSLDPTLIGLKELLVKVAGEGALKEIAKSDREHIAIGDQYFMSANYLSAQAHYKTAFEANPQNAMAAFKAGQALWRLNQGLEAIDWFKKAIQVDDNMIQAYVNLAEVLSSRFDFASASAILQKAQKQAPKNYEVYRGFAALALKRNDFQGAITSAKRALSLYDTDIQSILILSRAYRGSNQNVDAYAQMAQAIELEKNNPEVQALYGEILADVQGRETATSYLLNLYNTYPKVPEYGIALSRMYLRDEKNEAALDLIRQTVSVNPQHKGALIVQGEAFAKLNKLEDALASYLAAAALDPSDGEPLYMAGHVYLSVNQPLPAISQFERVLLVNPNFPKVRMSIGKAALLMGDRDRALKEVSEEKRINPGLADPYLLAGDIQMDLKNYTRATIEYQSALKLRTQGAEVYLKLARAYRLSSQYDAALSMLRAAETRESGNAEIAKEYGAVYELKSDNMSAVKFYNRYLQILPNAPDRSAIVDRINQLGGSLE